MTIDRIFLFYATVIGAGAAAILVLIPATRSMSIPPYFWVLIALGLFDLATFMRGKGAPGTMIAPMFRLAGFAVAIGLLLVLPKVAGVDLRLF